MRPVVPSDRRARMHGVVLVLLGLGILGYVASHVVAYWLAPEVHEPTAVHTHSHSHGAATLTHGNERDAPLLTPLHDYQLPVLAAGLVMLCAGLMVLARAGADERAHVGDATRRLIGSAWALPVTGLSAAAFVGMEFAEHAYVGAGTPDPVMLAIGIALQVLASMLVLARAARVVAAFVRVFSVWQHRSARQRADHASSPPPDRLDSLQATGVIVATTLPVRGPPARRVQLSGAACTPAGASIRGVFQCQPVRMTYDTESMQPPLRCLPVAA